MMPSHSLFRLLGKLRWTLACSCSPKFQQQFCNVSQNTNLAQKLVSLRAYRDTGLSHDFLHRALIVTIMIYKRRYGWQRWLNNSFQRSTHSSVRVYGTVVDLCRGQPLFRKHYFTYEGVDRWNELSVKTNIRNFALFTKFTKSSGNF